MEFSQLAVMLLLVSLTQVAQVRSKPTLSLKYFHLINNQLTITLSCDLQNWSGLEIRWYKNSQLVYYNVARSTNTLSVNVDNAGETVYRCEARWRSNYNHYTELSDPVRITAKEKPKLTAIMNYQRSIYPGDTVTLSCELEETTGWKFFWYQNSQLMNNEATKTLNMRVDKAGEAVYQCYATKAIYDHNNYNYTYYYYTLLSDSITIKAEEKPKLTVTANPQSSIDTGYTVILSCELEEMTGLVEFYWYRYSYRINTEATNITSVKVDAAQESVYRCLGSRTIYSSNYYTGWSDSIKIKAKANHKPTVRVNPQNSIYTGDTITLSCYLQQTTLWKFHYYKNSQLLNTVATNTVSVIVSNAGETVYQCRASKLIYKNYNNYDYDHTRLSDSVKISAKERPHAVLSLSPQSCLTEGDSVTLSCEVTDSSTDWTFSWYTVVPYRDGVTAIQNIHGYIMYVELLSDSSRGSGGFYTFSPSALHHTGVYVCRGERGEPAIHTQSSNLQPLWITGKSPPVSLIINPSRSQHFTGDSLSLSCEDQSNSTGWTVRRYTDSKRELNCSQWGSVTGSTCTISLIYTSDTGVYWCESESGENSNPLNITVHDGDVILESPVYPVSEGHSLTLRCLYHNTNPSNLRADFYKDGSVIQKQTTGEMIIYKVSKSDEGFYHCKHPEREESPKSWISVTLSGPGFSGGSVGLAVGLSLFFLFIAVLILMILLYYKMKKERQQESSQTSEWNQRNEDPRSGHTPLQAGNDNIYAVVDQADTSEAGEPEAESSEAMYAQVTKKKEANRNNVAGVEVTYADIQLKPMKKRAQEKTRVSDDTVYSELH